MKRFSTVACLSYTFDAVGTEVGCLFGVEEPGLELDPEYLEHPHWGQGAASLPWDPVYQNSSVRGPHAGSAGVKGKNDGRDA
jgi:hypothetical protein